MEIDSKGNQEKAFFGGGLHLLNTTIVPAGASGVWAIEDVNTEWAKHVVAHACHWSMFPYSHIGHQATATIAGELLAVGVEVDRTPWDGRGLGLALQLNGRPEEGKVLSREEMETLGYSWRILYRIGLRSGGVLPTPAGPSVGIGGNASPRTAAPYSSTTQPITTHTELGHDRRFPGVGCKS